MTEMIEHEGIVRSITHGKATIAVQTGGCNGCGHQSGCGLGRMAGERKSSEMTLAVDDFIKPGARVVLSLPQDRLLLGGVLTYLLPTISSLLVGGLAFSHYGTDGATALGSLFGLLLGLFGTRAMPAWIPAPTVRLLTPLQGGTAISFYKKT